MKARALARLNSIANPEAYAFMVLGIHGLVALSISPASTWHFIAVILVIVTSILGFFGRVNTAHPSAFALFLMLTWLLMLTTGGTSSFFMAWFFVLALYYPVQLPGGFGVFVAPIIALAYLLLLPFTELSLPLAIVLSRALLLTFVGSSIFILAHRLRVALAASQQDAEDSNLSAKRYRDLLEHSPDGAAITNNDLDFILVNDAFKNMVGYNEAELMTMTPADIIEKNDQKLNPVSSSTIPSTGSMKRERILVHKNGSQLWVEVNTKRLPNGNILTILRDTSERKKTEQILRYQASLLQSVQDAIIEVDLDLDIIGWNKGAEEMYGYSVTEAVGKNVVELLKISFPQTSQEAFFDILLKRGYWRGETQHERSTGELFHLSSLISVIYNQAGQPMSLVGINRDISDMVEAKDKVEASYSFLQQAIDASPNNVFVKDRNGNFTFVNKTFAAYNGLSKEDIIGKHERDLAHKNNEASLFLDLDQEVMQSHKAIVNFDVKHVNPLTNETRWFQTTKAPLLSLNNELQGILTVTNDVTARREAEQALSESELQFRKVFELSPSALMILRMKDNRFIDVNKSLIKLTGYTYEDFIGKTARDVGMGLELKKRETYYAQLSEFGVARNVELTLCTKEGEYREGLLSAELLELSGEKCRLAVFHDISEQKKAEHALQDMSRRLVSVQEEERRSLARELHDEIGQSLTAIKIGLQRLESSGAPKQLQQELRIVDDLVQRVRSLSLNLHPALLEKLGLEAALRWLFVEQSKQAGWDLTFDVDSTAARLPEELEISLYRIAQEALTNIIRHANATAVTLRLRHSNEHTELIIKDDGQGVADKSEQENPSLGLISIRERTLLLGGEFEIDSAPNKGTNLRVSFPKVINNSPREEHHGY